MRRALKDRLANYKIPQELKVVQDLPRNAMGKSKSTVVLMNLTDTSTVNKKNLVKEIFGEPTSS